MNFTSKPTYFPVPPYLPSALITYPVKGRQNINIKRKLKNNLKKISLWKLQCVPQQALLSTELSLGVFIAVSHCLAGGLWFLLHCQHWILAGTPGYPVVAHVTEILHFGSEECLQQSVRGADLDQGLGGS